MLTLPLPFSITEPDICSVQPVSAWNLFLTATTSPSRITTFSRSLDSLLDGGVPLGSVTEICGAPGVGKTQLCVQLAVNALIPEAFEGVGGKIISEEKAGPQSRAAARDDSIATDAVSGPAYVYVFDTEGSFVPRRIMEMAEATVDHLKRIANTLVPEEDAEAIDQARALSASGLCDRILISRCLSLEELLAGG